MRVECLHELGRRGYPDGTHLLEFEWRTQVWIYDPCEFNERSAWPRPGNVQLELFGE